MGTGVQRIPIDRESPARGLVLRSPGSEQFQARVIDIRQAIEFHLNLGVAGELFERCG
jgi:hypothetical protein